MAVMLYKEFLLNKVRRAITLEFPPHVSISYCKNKTNSKLVRTPHGMVRVYEVTEV